MLVQCRSLLICASVCITFLFTQALFANEAAQSEQPIEDNIGDVLLPPPPPAGLMDAYNESSGPSQFMAGDVAVLVVLPESDGSIEPSSEDWTQSQINQVTQQLQSAVDWWVEQLPQAQLHFHLEVQVVPTGYEPITHNLQEEGLWIGDVLGRMGYSGNYFERAYAAAYDIRRQKGTDWATLIFVANSDNAATGRFTDGKFGYAYINGPFMVLSSDSGSYGAHRLAPVAAHELGHIFGALDQYSAAQIPCNRRSGYLDAPTSNSDVDGCPSDLPSIMRSPLSAYKNNDIDPSALAQIGYYDGDEDGIIDPLDTTPTLQLDPVVPPIPGQRPRFSGQSSDAGYPSARLRTVSINIIERVEYRINNGPWQFAIPDDGAFDSTEEQFYTEAPLYDGEYHIEFRAINSAGINSDISDLTVEVSGIGNQPDYRIQVPETSNTGEISVLLQAPADTQAVQVSTDPLFNDVAWHPYADTMTYRLDAETDGVQYIYVRFRDAAGYESSVYAQQMLLDTRPPIGQIGIEHAPIPRAILDAEDNGSGVVAMEVHVKTHDASWQAFATEDAGQANESTGAWLPYTATISLPPETTSVRVRFRDAAGNISPFIAAQTGIYLPLIVR